MRVRRMHHLCMHSLLWRPLLSCLEWLCNLCATPRRRSGRKVIACSGGLTKRRPLARSATRSRTMDCIAVLVGLSPTPLYLTNISQVAVHMRMAGVSTASVWYAPLPFDPTKFARPSYDASPVFYTLIAAIWSQQVVSRRRPAWCISSRWTSS